MGFWLLRSGIDLLVAIIVTLGVVGLFVLAARSRRRRHPPSRPPEAARGEALHWISRYGNVNGR